MSRRGLMRAEPDYGPLFDVPVRHRARSTDPGTSHRAAEEIRSSLGELIHTAANLVSRYPGSTATELAQHGGYPDPRVINRRLSEAEKVGLIRRGEARICRVTGRRALTWTVDGRN